MSAAATPSGGYSSLQEVIRLLRNLPASMEAWRRCPPPYQPPPKNVSTRFGESEGQLIRRIEDWKEAQKLDPERREANHQRIKIKAVLIENLDDLLNGLAAVCKVEDLINVRLLLDAVKAEKKSAAKSLWSKVEPQLDCYGRLLSAQAQTGAGKEKKPRVRKPGSGSGNRLLKSTKREIVLRFIHENRFSGTLPELKQALEAKTKLKISVPTLSTYGAIKAMRRGSMIRPISKRLVDSAPDAWKLPDGLD